jgi:hypothetical protein
MLAVCSEAANIHSKWKRVTGVDQSGQLKIDTNGLTHDFSQNGNVITVTPGADEMLFLKP